MGHGVLSNLGLKVLTNTSNATNTLDIYQDLVPNGITISVGATTTGTFEDNTHTSVYSNTQELVYGLLECTNGTLSFLQIYCHYTYVPTASVTFTKTHAFSILTILPVKSTFIAASFTTQLTSLTQYYSLFGVLKHHQPQKLINKLISGLLEHSLISSLM